jgi:hypothetical protein
MTMFSKGDKLWYHSFNIRNLDIEIMKSKIHFN